MAPLNPSLLRRCPLFKNMPDAKLKRILRIARAQDFPEGSLIFNREDIANQMFIVASGRVRIYISSSARKHKTFAYLGTGAFFGEMALLDLKERCASAQAVEDSRLLIIHKRDFKQILLRDPRLCYQLLRTLCERLRNMNLQVENLLFCNILGRLARTILDLARQGGRHKTNGILIRDIYSRRELADLIGTTREPLSRALGSLQRAQLIQFQKDRILLRDPVRMQALVGAAAAEGRN